MSAELLKIHFTYSYEVVKRNVAGLSHEESLLQPPEGGNCLNWVVGHIVASRCGFLPLVGGEPVWGREEKERYDRGSEPITGGEEVMPLEKIMEDLRLSQKRLLESLSRLGEAELSAPAPYSPFDREDETLASLFVLYTFHESYHAGQTGLLRRLAGKAGAIP